MPQIYGGGISGDTSDTKKYCIIFNEFVDRILVELKSRYSPESSNADIAKYQEPAGVLWSGEITYSVSSYPELTKGSLTSQVKAFRLRTTAKTLYDAKKAFQKYPQVLHLIKILLVCPASSAHYERSFSTLRRLKTWLRNNIGQERLNYNIVCNVRNFIRKLIN